MRIQEGRPHPLPRHGDARVRSLLLSRSEFGSRLRSRARPLWPTHTWMHPKVEVREPVGSDDIFVFSVRSRPRRTDYEHVAVLATITENISSEIVGITSLYYVLTIRWLEIFAATYGAAVQATCIKRHHRPRICLVRRTGVAKRRRFCGGDAFNGALLRL